ncbi:hypothetical protein [Paraburkholderia sp.]|nr:hypothetical protein [Paraburkholderia sp.]MDE1183646.1 hypothetical protein [Paraburkholderia sp.]
MKRLLAVIAVVLLCSACAGGGGSAATPGSGSITMYGTIDEGVSVRK